MTWFEQVSTFFEFLAAYAPFIGAPHQIEVDYPPESNGAGTRAGRYLLERDGKKISYQWQRDPDLEVLSNKLAEFEQNHTFERPESMAHFLRNWDSGKPSIWVFGEPFETRSVVAALDVDHPEIGALGMTIQRHPTWTRWTLGLCGGARDLSHSQIADLLIDNQEDLEEPAIAKVISAFRSAKTITYDADLGDAGSVGVKVGWKGAGGKKGAESEIAIPREFSALIPAYVGAWQPGFEPKHKAVFRLRVLPPPKDEPEAAPLFRVLWLNAMDFELEAANDLQDRAEDIFDSWPVYSGSPKATRYVLP